MNVVSSYVHALQGRLRIKIPEVKGSSPKAGEVESHLQLLEGMEHVSANPVTGNVLILYNPRLIREGQIISSLEDLGYLGEAPPKVNGTSGVGHHEALVERLTTFAASTIMEVALTRLVTALI